MSEKEGTEVYCAKCGRSWTTHAKKKAVCTNKDCKSIKIHRVADDSRYNETTDFIRARTNTAKKMKAPLEQFVKEESAEPVSEFQDSEKKILKDLFQEDGRTPKMEIEGVGSLLAGLPKPSPYLVSSVQNFSLIPARLLGIQWIMADEEAELIAGSLIPVLKELGINVNKLDPKISLAIALGIYALPRVLVMLFGGGAQPDMSSTEGRPVQRSTEDTGTPPPKNSPITHAEKVEAEFEQFRQYYGDSLDEEGKDKYKNKRGIKKAW